MYEVTKNRNTPFKNGILKDGWLRGFRHRHPKLILKVAKALEASRAQDLCKENMQSFNDNLSELYTLYKYPPKCILNCDKTGMQAGRIGRVVVIAHIGAGHMHHIVPNQCKWFSVLVCTNVVRLAIPSFYVFKGKHFCLNYLRDVSQVLQCQSNHRHG